jgi:drug/metabolite transporter superfamily protein YnfA
MSMPPGLVFIGGCAKLRTMASQRRRLADKDRPVNVAIAMDRMLLRLMRWNLKIFAWYNDNPLRHDLWRAGHAMAGVFLVLSLVMLRYVDEAALSPFWKWLARTGAPIAAILIPAAFFLSVASPTSKQPSGLMNLAYISALFLAAAVLSLGVDLIRASRRMER